ncbi:RNA-binding region-containing protein 3-like [Aphis gossypii]|uniref:RNA-binding region-containing protein 3-like n=1 Tax=Aphis gossypii TaxID=80765 RepID=UPI00215966E4|nr:RNA-binding region-containing protein 3-like [Aphis gossypii]XP_027838777.2 RNA-binding region-containing protein 3-like [Aphis gossypii]
MASATIIVRHFPPQISSEDKEEFLKYFGAKYVKILTSKTNRRSIAYARFESQEFAEAVIQRLHQKELLGHRLTVELSANDLDVNLMKCPKPPPVIECNTDNVKQLQEDYLKKLNSWSAAIDLNQPPPHHLHYSYPDPNPYILSNIANALACNQKFYYQVLHLMNRMNLPAPFEPVIGFPLNKFMKIETADKYTTTDETDPELSESEMESDNESDHNIEPKFSLLKKKIYKVIKPKRLKNVATTVTKKAKVELANVFDTVECEIPKKIEVKVSAELNPVEGPTADTEGGFGVIYSSKSINKEVDKKESESDDDLTGDCISKEELATNRLSDKDINNMPIFKNYHPGAPSCRLYIKNLAKTVLDNDLKYIYKRFIKSGDLKPGTMFDIRLMQEGRMKGQAFVTLPCVENAQQALKETNGYILKDKPMIVQFARSATAK